MFKKLKNKIQVELNKEQTSANASMCSSMSSSRADLTQDDQNLQNQKQAFDSLSALVVNNEIEEEDDSEEIVQKFSQQSIKPKSSRKNSLSLNDEDQKIKEHEQVLDDLLNRVENSFNNKIPEASLLSNINSQSSKRPAGRGSIETSDGQLDKLNDELKQKASELDELQARYRKLENEFKEQIRQNKKLEILNVNLQNTKHEANIRNNKLFNKLDELKKQSKQSQDKLAKFKEENHLLSGKNDELKQIIESMKEELEFEKQEKAELNKLRVSAQTKSEPNRNEQLVDDLKERIVKLEDQVAEKKKTIKLQNQRIHDIKKSVQKGDLFLRDENTLHTINTSANHNNRAPAQLSNGSLENGYSSRNGSSTRLDEQIVNGKHQVPMMINEAATVGGRLNNNKDYATHVNDINFKYLQNVVLKFITATDHESQKHLVKAISTLLKFSNEEEQIIKQSLDTRTSWFKI